MSTSIVAKEDADIPLGALAFNYIVVDVALFFQDTGYFKLKLRRRNVHTRVLR